jgi:hypothetical protein
MFFRGGLQQLPQQINDVLDNNELSDQEKLRKLIKIDFLKTQVGVQINQRLVDFLQKREMIQELVKLSLATPSDPMNIDESFR